MSPKPYKGPPPAPLGSDLVEKLLDELTTSPDFRRRFSQDAKSALESIGYVAPAADKASHIGGCLQLKAGTKLASAQDITARRSQLVSTLNAVQDFACPVDLCPD